MSWVKPTIRASAEEEAETRGATKIFQQIDCTRGTADCHRKLGHVKAFSASRGRNFQIPGKVIDGGALSRESENAMLRCFPQIDKPVDDRSLFVGVSAACVSWLCHDGLLCLLGPPCYRRRFNSAHCRTSADNPPFDSTRHERTEKLIQLSPGRSLV